MKKPILLLLTCLLAGVASAQQFPNVKVEHQEGAPLQTAALIDGKTPFILTFWSTTCKPCINELDALYESYEDWSAECDFRVVAVSIDDARSKARAKAMAKSRQWDTFVLVYDQNQDFKRAMNVVVTPQTYIYDKDGNQVYAKIGYNAGSEEDLFTEIKKLK